MTELDVTAVKQPSHSPSPNSVRAYRVRSVKGVMHVGNEDYLQLIVDEHVDDPDSDPLIVYEVNGETRVLWKDRLWRVLDPAVMELFGILSRPVPPIAA